MDQFADLIGSVLSTVLTALATAGIAAVVQYIRKLGIQISAEQEAKAKVAAESAVLQVEEQVEAKIRETARPIANKGRVKLEKAVEIITAKVPGVSEDEARALATEAVARVGLGATAAVGKVLEASRTP